MGERGDGSKQGSKGVEVKVFFPETFQSPRLAFLRFLKSCS